MAAANQATPSECPRALRRFDGRQDRTRTRTQAAASLKRKIFAISRNDLRLWTPVDREDHKAVIVPRWTMWNVALLRVLHRFKFLLLANSRAPERRIHLAAGKYLRGAYTVSQLLPLQSREALNL